MGEHGHGCVLLRRRRGFGPRRVCSSSALQLQPPQRVVPHALERRADRTERSRRARVEAVPVLAADVDESGLGQRAELQRDGAERHVRHGGVDVAGGELAVPHQAQDLAAARRGDGGEDGGVEHGYI